MSKKRHLLTDKSILAEAAGSLTPNGYLPISARIARSGVQEYLAAELWPLFEDRAWDDIIRLWRPPEEVFAPEALASFNRLPVTDNHPWDDVAATNWKEFACGYTEGSARRDDMFVRQDLLITDAGLINDIQIGLSNDGRNGKCEVSCGWTFVLEETSGVTPQGEAYDLVAREIRGNHIAIVDMARCGPECRIGDRLISPQTRQRLTDSCSCKQPPQAKDEPMADSIKTRTVVHDGVSIETTEQGAQVIDKLTGERDEARTKLAAADAALSTARTEHEAAIAAKDAEIAALKDAQPTAEKLEQMARDHAGLVQKAKAMLGDSANLDGKTGDEIRKAVVDAKLGDTAKDYTADQVRIAFDTLAAQVKDTKPGIKPAPQLQRNDPFTPSTPAAVATVTSLEDSRRQRAQAQSNRWKK